MKRILLAVMLSAVAIGAHADTGYFLMCDPLAALADAIMSERHSGISQQAMIDKYQGNTFSLGLVDIAWSQPDVVGDTAKQQEGDWMRDMIREQCVKNAR